MYEEGYASAEEWMDFDEQEARAAADAEEAEREAADYENWQAERELEERELRSDGKTHAKAPGTPRKHFSELLNYRKSASATLAPNRSGLRSSDCFSSDLAFAASFSPR